MFRRDGEELAVGTRAEQRLIWMTRNSIIRRVFAFAEIVAVVHSRTETVSDPQLGGLPRLNVFVNLYSRDGAPLVSDIPLSDLPVGRDSSHLYVIDYGPMGRRPAAPGVRLLRIPVSTKLASLRPAHEAPGRPSPLAISKGGPS